MNLVLFAYRNCGYDCLDYLISINKKPILVVIPKSEDKKEKIFKSVKKLALNFNVNFFEYNNNKLELTRILKKINPDYGFSCYYPYIIPENILKIFNKNTFNIHGGILPNYKGTLSSVWSLINGENITGSTIHKMIKDVDCGDIIEISKCKIDEFDTGKSLYNKVSILSSQLFIKYINILLKKSSITSKKQKLNLGKYYKREIPNNGRINWNSKSKEIFNFCRALYFPPYKSSVTYLNNIEFEIDLIQISSTKSINRPGKIVNINDEFIEISTIDFNVTINKDSIDIKKIKLFFKKKKSKFL